MPAVLSYPGVYIEEISSGVRTITGVATSRTAFVGRAQKGPVNEPVIVNSYTDFERIFGGLWYESTLSYAVRDFYLNGGSQAVIVRLFNPLFSSDDARLETLNMAKVAATTAAGSVAFNARKVVTDNPITAKGEDVAVKAEESKKSVIDIEINKIPPGTLIETENAIKYAVQAAATAVAKAARDAVSSPNFVASEAENAAKAITGGVPAMKAAKDVAVAARSIVTANARAEEVRNKAREVNDKYIKIFSDASEADNAAKDVASKARAAVTTNPPNVLKEAEAAKNNWDIPENPQNVRDAAVAVYNAVTLINDKHLGDEAMAKAAEDLEKSKYLKDAEDAQSASQAATAVFNAADSATHNADYVAAAAEKVSLTAPDDAAAEAAPIPKARIIVDNLIFEAANEGSWSNGIQIFVDYAGDADIAKRLEVDQNTIFNMVIKDKKTGATEKFIGLTTEPNNSRSLDRVLMNESNLVRLWDPKLPTPRPKINDPDKPYSVPKEGNASDGKDLDPTDFTKDGKKGIHALDKIDLFNMLCLPPITRDTEMPNEVYQEAQMYCTSRRAILIVDAPKNWSASNAVEELAKSNLFTEGRNAAIYFPWLLMSDPLRKGQLDYFAPSGAVAGIIARTDAKRGVWKAPAGLDASINGIAGLHQDLTDSENGMLNPQGINCLRNFRSNGIVIWGARTLRGGDQFADEWKYLPVRRLALYIEESLYRGTQWIVFEPNDEPLWAQIRLNIGAFMHSLFRQGAFKGSSPRDAYFVKCDKETTNSTDINNGVVNIIVGFAPLKPAEFVVIKLQQMAGQIEV